jgi:hypothetical protein
MQDDVQSRWLTYAELAESRGISRPSAIRLARRRKWPHRAGNDGTARVLVPAGEETARRAEPDDATIALVAAFEAGLTALRAQLTVERARADRLQEELTDLRVVLAVERAARRSWLFGRWRGRG